VAEEHTNQLTATRQRLLQRRGELHELSAKASAESKAIAVNRGAANARIEKEFKGIQEAVEARKQQLLGEVSANF